ncbi:ABC transporter permease, partial [Bacillus sp. SIMBA_069]
MVGTQTATPAKHHTKIVINRFFANRLAVSGSILVLLITLICVLAPV